MSAHVHRNLTNIRPHWHVHWRAPWWLFRGYLMSAAQRLTWSVVPCVHVCCRQTLPEPPKPGCVHHSSENCVHGEPGQVDQARELEPDVYTRTGERSGLCDNADAFADSELGREQLERFVEHLWDCPACVDHLGWVFTLKRLLARKEVNPT